MFLSVSRRTDIPAFGKEEVGDKITERKIKSFIKKEDPQLGMDI
ncbi:MAG: hypothetical protein ACYDIA_08410 [Candidatus Humimicrobiaceae bacterium]